MARPGGPHEAADEEIEVRMATHLALQHLEAIDMSLYGATTPGNSHPCFDRLVILVEPGGKASHEVPGILTTQLL